MTVERYDDILALGVVILSRLSFPIGFHGVIDAFLLIRLLTEFYSDKTLRSLADTSYKLSPLFSLFPSSLSFPFLFPFLFPPSFSFSPLSFLPFSPFFLLYYSIYFISIFNSKNMLRRLN